MNATPQRRSVVGRLGKLFEDALLVTLLAALITLATTQIVLRNFFDTGLGWSDELSRLLVLWLAMAAAVAASREDRHIAIDVLSRFVSGRLLALTKLVIALFTCAVCALLAWHSGRFVSDARSFGDLLLGSVPAWWLQAVMPVAFALMSYRYLAHAVHHLRTLAGRAR